MAWRQETVCVEDEAKRQAYCTYVTVTTEHGQRKYSILKDLIYKLGLLLQNWVSVRWFYVQFRQLINCP